jgi:hypothetical protein
MSALCTVDEDDARSAGDGERDVGLHSPELAVLVVDLQVARLEQQEQQG